MAMATESEAVPATVAQIPTTSWDPYQYLENRTPTNACLQRIRKDLKTMLKDPLPGIFAVPDDTIVTIVHALIVGPFGTPYEGGFFHFIVNFPDNYPENPPKVKLMTTGAGTVRFNPNRK